VTSHGDPVAVLFAELLAHARAETPMAIAVVGPAGSGKSSFVEATLARLGALCAAADASSPFLSQVVAVKADLSRLPPDASRAEILAALAAATRRSLVRAGGAFGKAGEEAAAACGDSHASAREAEEAYDGARKRLDAEERELEQARTRRARLTDALLYDTPGSKVDAFARARRSRIDAGLRAFGYGAGDAGTTYRQLVGEVAETQSGAALSRVIWGFPQQRRLLMWAAVFFGLWLLAGWARETQTAWAPWLRAQNAGALADFFKADTLRWISTALLTLSLFYLARNLWRAWRFTTPLRHGARLLRDDVAERGVELDRAIQMTMRRVDVLRSETEAARKAAEAAARRAKQGAADGDALVGDIDATDPSERFVEAAARALTRGGARARLVLALDGADHLRPASALSALEAATRLASASGAALVAAFDPAKLSDAGAPRDAQDRLERLFQASWRLEATSLSDQERLMSAALAGAPLSSPPKLDASRSLLDEPLAASEVDLMQRLVPLVGGAPRRIKRLANLYRISRIASPNRPVLALALAAELGGVADATTTAVEAISSGPGDVKLDPAVIAAVAATAEAAPAGALTTHDLAAARRLARRFAAFEAA
jgi:hypothetical protein